MLRNIALVSLLVVFCSPALLSIIKGAEYAAFEIIAACVLSSLFIMSLRLLINANAMWFYWCVGLPIVAFCIPENLHMMEYDSQISVGGWESIFSSSFSEGIEFFTSLRAETVVLLSVCAAVYLLAPIVLIKKTLPPSRKMKITASVFVVVFMIDLSLKGVTRLSFPESLLWPTIKMMEQSRLQEGMMETRNGFRFDATLAADAGEEMTLVLVLGETLRREHLGVYGYKRNTTEKLGQYDDIYWYSDVISAGKLTQVSVASMLTPATSQDGSDFYKKLSFISVAKELGYKTYWISNHDEFHHYNTRVSVIAKESDVTQFISRQNNVTTYDGDMQNYFEKALNDGNKKRLIILHMMGSHSKFDRRYPKGFDYYKDIEQVKRWLPQLEDKDAKRFNAYDNSVRYSDTVISDYIEAVRRTSKNSAILFSPDHGPYLFDRGSLISGQGIPNYAPGQIEIPLFIWLSDTYAKNHPAIVAGIKQNQHKPISNADIFHTMTGLMRAECVECRQERDFSSLRFEPVIPRYYLDSDFKPQRYSQTDNEKYSNQNWYEPRWPVVDYDKSQ